MNDSNVSYISLMYSVKSFGVIYCTVVEEDWGVTDKKK
jgi:hypothetical protein